MAFLRSDEDGIGLFFVFGSSKTLLKLTIPRIKLLRKRREIQIRQMRRDIAKLLESGQEATACIRVEHIIREEKMMVAQEILELYCELIAVRLPIIEVQRDCSLDLKEAISSVCFAALRCADLPELLQVQISFSSKYGQEFVAAATELMPNCGVNCQLIELLSVRAPSPESKLKLLKDIAEEHELEWDPTASENELLKSHEDLLNGLTQFGSGSKVPLPKEKHEESFHCDLDGTLKERPGSKISLQMLDFPEVLKESIRPNLNAASVSVSFLTCQIRRAGMSPRLGHGISEKNAESNEVKAENIVDYEDEETNPSVSSKEGKQFVPFIAPPLDSPGSYSPGLWAPQSSFHRMKSYSATVDLQGVRTAAQAAAETAERAAAAARSVASLAQMRISDHVGTQDRSADGRNVDREDHQIPLDDQDKIVPSAYEGIFREETDSSSSGPYKVLKFDSDFPDLSSRHDTDSLVYKKSTSIEDEPNFAYPNPFSSQNSF